MLLIGLVVILVAFILIYDLYFLKNATKLKVPGPTPLPFVGSGHLFLGDSVKFLSTLNDLIKQYGELIQAFVLSVRFFLIAESKHVEAVLSSTNYITKGETYDFLHPWLGQGLLTATGPRWKAHRKFLTGAFHFNILKTFLPVFYKNDEVFIKKLEAIADGTSVDLFPLVALLALDNISESAMGVSLNAQNDSKSEYVKAVNVISELVFKRMRHPILYVQALFNLTPSKRKHDKALRVLHRYTERVVEGRRRALDLAKATIDNYELEIGIKKKSAFLDMLLLSEVDGKRLDNQTVREEVDTFMFEGHDTTTSGICYTLYSISNYSDVQEKLYDEQHSIFGDDVYRHPTYNELVSMKYLEMVIRESLRLYPSVPFISRLVTEDTRIADTEVPKGTNLVISIFHMQRSPNVFEDPLVFKPERFEVDTRNHQNAFNWVSFSAGPRNCIGQKFAMMEMKLVISSIIRKFKLLPSGKEPQLCADLILRSTNGVQVGIMPRK